MAKLDGTEHIPIDQGVIITDCCDPNAQARLQVRFASLFGLTPSFIGVKGENADLAAAGHLVDVLDAAKTPDAFGQARTVILVNVAPRGDDIRKKYENGTPFCHAETGNTTILSTYEGRALSLTYALGLISVVNVLDIPTVTHSLVADEILTEDEANYINNTQFRSLEFEPLAARLIVDGRDLLGKSINLKLSANVEGLAWHIDSFGNIKTTAQKEEIGFEIGKTILLAGGAKATCYERLTDVPTGDLGLTIGSSGYGNQRLLELAVQKGRAADRLGVEVGSKVLEAI